MTSDKSGVQPSSTRHRMKVKPPFRLDLTVTALRRLPLNAVDILTPGGEYLRAWRGGRRTQIVRVRQTRPDQLAIDLIGVDGKEERRGILALLRRMLGVDRDLSGFYQAAGEISWLRPLLERAEGVKPPRYPTLWESCVRVVLFQQISLQAASTITRRLIETLSTPVESKGVVHYPFPGLVEFLATPDGPLRACGISPSKLVTLRRLAEAIRDGELRDEELEALPTPEAAEVLQGIKGIGPWSATVILLRGFGRLDLFPMSDSSVTANLKLVSGRQVNVTRLISRLGEQRGMLYYYLLLARLTSREEKAEARAVARKGSRVRTSSGRS